MKELEKIKFKIANVFRVTRKLSGDSQKEFAIRLGITQGTVSKLENGTLGPDAVLWYLFCKEFNLYADVTYKTGLLFFKEQVFFKGNEFRMGGYSLDRFIKVKEVIPFLKTTEELEIKEEYFNLLEEKGIDRDAFLIPEYIVPFELLKEIVDFSTTEKTKKDFLNSSVKHFISDKTEIIADMGYTYSQFIRYINENDPFFNIQSKGKKVSVDLIPNFKFSLEEQETLKAYMTFKTKAIVQTLAKAFDLKGIKAIKLDDFSYSIGV